MPFLKEKEKKRKAFDVLFEVGVQRVVGLFVGLSASSVQSEQKKEEMARGKKEESKTKRRWIF